MTNTTSAGACAVCGDPTDHTYCSTTCSGTAWARRNSRPSPPTLRDCVICGTTMVLVGKGRRATCCSDRCKGERDRLRERSRERTRRPDRLCSKCGVSVIPKTRHVCDSCKVDARDRAEYERQRVFRRHGVSAEWFAAQLERQGHACAVCGASEPGGKGSWCIDHDHSCCNAAHSCGECVRGLLCSNCNTAIGQFRDDTTVMAAAIRYVLEYRKG